MHAAAAIAVDGQLQSRQYQTKDGQNRTAIEVVADNISFTGERRESASAYGSYAQPSRGNDYGSQVPPAAPQQPAAYSAGSADDFQVMPLDDDLPF